MLYNDKNVLESHHLSAAFRMLQEEECDIISNLKPEEYRLHAPAPS